MELSKEELNQKYSEAERRLTKKDYTGNILYLPFDPEEEYFYILNSQTRSMILDQLNSQFDVQEKLNVSKRTTALDVVFKKGEEPLPVYVFCRYTKGKPHYTSRKGCFSKFEKIPSNFPPYWIFEAAVMLLNCLWAACFNAVYCFQAPTWTI